MTLIIIAEPSAAQQQVDRYNRNSEMVKQKEYLPPAGIAWAVIGLVLVDSATPSNENMLITAMQNLDAIELVANPRFWVPTPDEVLINPGGGKPDTHRVVLSVEAITSGEEGYDNDLQSFQNRKYEEIAPPLGKKCLVCNCVLLDEIVSAQMIEDLEQALKGIVGVMAAEHIISGRVPSNASNVSLTITTRMRIDDIPLTP